MLAAALSYYLLPGVEQKFKFITPGSVIGTLVWFLGSWCFGRSRRDLPTIDSLCHRKTLAVVAESRSTLGKNIGRTLLIKLCPRTDTIEKETTNMSGAVSSATQPQPAPQPTDVRAKAREPRPQPGPSDTVQLSSAAQAALREAMETPAQTAKEAGAGDVQAKRLLAKEAAAKAESAPSKHVVA